MSAVAATGGIREARRRRIVERGADRLALITGRIQSLPPDPHESRSSESLPGQTLADVAEHEHAASNPDQDSARPHISDEKKELFLENINGGNIVCPTPLDPPGVEREQSQISEEQSRIKSPSMQSFSQAYQIEHRHRNLFTAGQISSAMSASENARMCFSVAAAIVVVIGCCNIRTAVVILKPLYLLLLTNISIVFAHLILGTRAPKARTGQTRSAPKLGGNALVDQMGTALELGLLLKKVFEAMFMDFSIYVIALICGLSLLRVLGL